jgi:hypothetical protein
MTDSGDPIDWGGIAEELKALEHHPDGARTERGGSALARTALERLLTSAQVSWAVDRYVSASPGFELARSVLWLLRPWSAMMRCKELYDSAPDIQKRRAAVELLRVVADARVLPWISDFLNDGDEEIQVWGIGVLEQLAFSDLVEPERCSTLLGQAATHVNERVRSQAAQIASSFATDPSGPSASSCLLNVDLEIYSPHDLSPLVEALAQNAFQLERPPGRVAFELNQPVSPSEPEPLVREFVRLVQALPPSVRAVWESASKRAFDIGFQSPRGSFSSDAPITQSAGCPTSMRASHGLTPITLRAAAEVDAEIAVTIYASDVGANGRGLTQG